MRNFRLAALALGLLQVVAGCSGSSDPKARDANSSADSAATGEGHDHASEGPHHGVLIELGDEAYHAELIHTADTVTVYILDKSAKVAVPVDAEHITINLVADGKPEQFSLMASPETSEGANKSSRFVITNPELVHHLDEPASSPKLIVTIDGTPYRGDVRHDHAAHAHGDHDHSSHEDSGHDHAEHAH
jgi:hypothetical protein